MIRVVLAVLLVFTAQTALALEVTAVRASAQEGKNRLVFELSDMTEFKLSTQGPPYKMIVDLPYFSWQAAPLNNPKATGISAVRHGQVEDDISRIILDIKNPFKIQNVFMLENPPRLVVDFARSSADAFLQSTGKTYGYLGRGDHEPVTQATLTMPEPEAEPVYEQIEDPDSVVKKPLIIIDPGHGGVDPGAGGANGLHEKNVVLKLAKELKAQLLASGNYQVKMTRENDVFIKLHDRVKFARKNGGDLFVSIHADSIDKPSIQGASVYTLSEKASDAQTAKLAARENQADLIAGIDLSVEDEDVANILVDLAMRDTMNQSKFFANKLVSVMDANGVRTLDNTHRYAGFAVLKAPDIPSVLVEAGFMSNSQEANQLNTSAYRAKVAGSIKRGIDAYFNQLRKNGPG